jgi:hypothetical protein
MDKLVKLREVEFERNNFIYNVETDNKKDVEKKGNENPVEFKKFQYNIKKQGKYLKREYIPNSAISILDDDIFNNNVENTVDEVKLEIESLERDKKMELINDFIQRKNIILDENEYKKIESIIDNHEISIKKYFNISKMYQQISKISFIKKLENGTYIVDLNENKIKKTKKFFNK